MGTKYDLMEAGSASHSLRPLSGHTFSFSVRVCSNQMSFRRLQSSLQSDTSNCLSDSHFSCDSVVEIVVAMDYEVALPTESHHQNVAATSIIDHPRWLGRFQF